MASFATIEDGASTARAEQDTTAIARNVTAPPPPTITWAPPITTTMTQSPLPPLHAFTTSTTPSPSFDPGQFLTHTHDTLQHAAQTILPESDPAVPYLLWGIIALCVLLALLVLCLSLRCYCTYGVGPLRLTCMPRTMPPLSQEASAIDGRSSSQLRVNAHSPAPSTYIPMDSTVVAAAAAAAAAAVRALERPASSSHEQSGEKNEEASA
jgi:hypothetical protein